MASLVEIGKRILDPNVGVQPYELGSSYLELLLGDVARAIDRQDLPRALRLADRARRIAPGTSSCRLLYARLLIEAGLGKRALDYLDGDDDPDIVLVRGFALLEDGLLAAASTCCAGLLRGFSVDAVQGLPLLASQICRAKESGFRSGWIGVDNRRRLVGETRRGSRVEVESPDGSHRVLSFEDRPDGWVSFADMLPPEFHGQVFVRADGCELLGSGFQWPLDYRLSAWVALDGETLVGEAQLGWSPKLPVTLEVLDSERGETRTFSTEGTTASGAPSFSTSLLASEAATSQLEVSAVLPDGSRRPVVGSPLTPGRRSAVTIDERPSRIQNGHRLASNVALKTTGIIDIIVPVYAGRRETIECLESVLRTTDRERVEVIVVDDASPDLELRDSLAGLAADKRITLIANARNLGFAGSVNLAMSLHGDRDAILLNSDTQVAGDWVERLTAAAAASPDIGTVTPLGQNGSITDYEQGNPSGSGSVEEIDRIARGANAGRSVDIPVGVGFCMYIKRECFSETGELDAATFGRGYGEENDFCLRARHLGWRHVAATDVFIGHYGGRSFGGTAALLRKRSGRVLNALYPGYAGLIESFSAADPLLEARRAIDMARLAAEATDPVLIVTHDLSGGVKRHIAQRETELRGAGHTVLILQRSASSGSTAKVSLTVHSLGLVNLVFEIPAEGGLLEQLFRDIGLSHLELHHFLGLPPQILRTVTQLNVPYDIYIHDYAWICPRVKLIGGSGRYCGEPELAACETCVATHGSAMEEPLTVSALRSRSAALLSSARRIIAPSADVRERLGRYFPELTVETTPWELVPNPARKQLRASAGRVRVAVIGAIGIPKGYDLLLECARDAAARNLDLDFVVIGYTADDRPLLDTGRVFITGPYEEDEVGMLIEREDCHVALFPSVSPETWCYSLTHAIDRGMPIVAFDLGAQAERLRAYPSAQLLPLSLNAQQVNFALARCSESLTDQPEQPLAGIDPSGADEQREPVNTESRDLVSSVQVLNLPEGVYSFTVTEGVALRDGAGTPALPALQVGIGPSAAAGNVEFLTGASNVDRWLAYKADMVVVRILGGGASLSLTSVHKPDSPSLAVDVERLNAHPGSRATDYRDTETYAGEVPGSLPARLMAHLRYIGDLDFDAGWAGWPGQKMWIEGFAISAVAHLPADCIEYRGLVANGLQTPWLRGQALCGSRGGGLPLLGYAARVRPEFGDRYECSYSGRFFSGAKVGPLQDGVLCSSDLPGDPLEALEIRMLDRQLQVTATPDLGVTPLYG